MEGGSNLFAIVDLIQVQAQGKALALLVDGPAFLVQGGVEVADFVGLDRVGDALDLENELSKNLKSLPAAEFEQVLHPIFQEDEKRLIAVGAILGGVAGIIQWLVVSW